MLQNPCQTLHRKPKDSFLISLEQQQTNHRETFLCSLKVHQFVKSHCHLLQRLVGDKRYHKELLHHSPRARVRKNMAQKKQLG